MLGSIWDQFGVMLGSFLAVRTGRSPERGGRQNGQTLARLGPPDWRQLGSQIGGPARLARTPERPERQNARTITASPNSKASIRQLTYISATNSCDRDIQ